MWSVQDLVRLLVGPLAGDERGDVQLVHERRGSKRIRDLGDVVVVVADLRFQVRLLGMEGLIRLAGQIAVIRDLVLGVGLSAVARVI